MLQQALGRASLVADSVDVLGEGCMFGGGSRESARRTTGGTRGGQVSIKLRRNGHACVPVR